MSNIAIIPARGGSKRIPRKNIREFLGKPIIAYSIEAALSSGLFDEVMVSTDDQEIADIAKEYGAEVPFMRDKATASDTATTVEVLLEVIKNYEAKGKYFTYGCCIYPTAPLVKIEDLDKGYHLLRKEGFDSVFPVCSFGYPIWRSLRVNKENGQCSMVWPEHLNSRSQDLETIYHDAGQFYWFASEAIRSQKKLYCNNSGVIILNEEDVQDIDNESDWQVAEMKFQLKFSKCGRE